MTCAASADCWQWGDRMLVSDGAWMGDSEKCPADYDYVQYMEANKVQWSSLFHMGPGGHHLLGRTLAQNGRSNSIIAITNSRAESTLYSEWAEQHPSLSRWYKVLFGDIHQLDERQLPRFDYVSLFHLGEMGAPPPYAHLSIEGVVSMFAERLLTPHGRLVFYRRSAAWDKVEPLIAQLGWEQSEFASLLVLRKP